MLKTIRVPSTKAVRITWRWRPEEISIDRSSIALFSERKTPWLGPVALSASRPSLLRADGCPIVVHTDANIYFAQGNVEISWLTPDGTVTPLVTILKQPLKSSAA